MDGVASRKANLFIVGVFTLLSFLLVSLWFKDGLMFAGGEDQIPFYNIPRALELFSSPWQDVGMGFPQVFNIPKIGSLYFLNYLWHLGLTQIALQKLVFMCLLITGSTAISLTSFTITKKLSLSLLSGIFYLLNPYSLGQVWGRGLYFQFFFFALLPVTVYLQIKWFEKKSGAYLVAFAVASWLLSWAFGHPAHLITLALVQVLIAFHYRKQKNILLSCLIWFGSWLLINSYWLLPFFYYGQKLFSGISDPQNNIEIFESLSSQTTLPWVLRLMSKNLFSSTSAYGSHYGSFLFQAVSWLIPITVILGLKNLTKNPYAKLVIALCVIGVIVSLGSNSPFGFITKAIMQNVPQLQVYRNSFEKFGFVLLLGMSLALPHAFTSFKARSLRLFSQAFFIGSVCILFAWPLWNGEFSGGKTYRPWIKIPSDYSEIASWLSAHNPTAKIMQLPLLPGDGVRYTWEHPYQGIEASEYIFSSPSIGRDMVINQDYYTALLDRFGKTSAGATLPGRGSQNANFKKASLSEELAILNVQYIVLHKDIDTRFSGASSLEDTRTILQKDKNISLIKSSANLEVYEIKFPIPSALFTLDDQPVNYSKRNSSTYTITLPAGDHSLTQSVQYHPLWQLDLNGHLTSPEKVSDVANHWSISLPERTVAQIIFLPQLAYERGLTISLSATAIIISIYFFTQALRVWSVVSTNRVPKSSKE